MDRGKRSRYAIALECAILSALSGNEKNRGITLISSCSDLPVVVNMACSPGKVIKHQTVLALHPYHREAFFDPSLTYDEWKRNVNSGWIKDRYTFSIPNDNAAIEALRKSKKP